MITSLPQLSANICMKITGSKESLEQMSPLTFMDEGKCEEVARCS